ncbi:MAG: tetratricopeptide repeat protein, partial [Bacteroidales bacterium]
MLILHDYATMTKDGIWISVAFFFVMAGCQSPHSKQEDPQNTSYNKIQISGEHRAQKFEAEGKTDSAIFLYDRMASSYIQERKMDAAIRALIKSASLEKDRKNSRLMRQKALLADSLASLYFPNHDSLKAEILHQLGNAELIHGNYPIALEYFNQSKELKENLFGIADTLLSSTYNSLGVTFFMLADFEKALDYYQKALQLAKSMKTKSNKLIPRISENLGMIYDYLGDYSKAIFYFGESLRLKSQIFGLNSGETARAYLNIANFLITLSNYDEAKENLLKAEKIFINQYGTEYKDLADVYMNLGKIYNSGADYDKAQIYFNKSSQIMRKINPEYPGLR